MARHRDDEDEFDDEDEIERPRPRGRRRPDPLDDPALKYLIPVNLSNWAAAAGYLGLFAVLCAPAPLALGCGLMGLRATRRNPKLGGRGRAWFGVVMGGLFTLPLVAALVSLAVTGGM